MQIIHLILDKILKLSTYYMPFYRQSLQSYAISKTVQFFGPPCIKKFFCLRLSLCLLVSWAWLDRPLTWLTNHRPSVLWQCWLGHLTCKIVSETTYNGYPWDVKPYCTIPYLSNSAAVFSFLEMEWLYHWQHLPCYYCSNSLLQCKYIIYWDMHEDCFSHKCQRI